MFNLCKNREWTVILDHEQKLMGCVDYIIAPVSKIVKSKNGSLNPKEGVTEVEEIVITVVWYEGRHAKAQFKKTRYSIGKVIEVPMKDSEMEVGYSTSRAESEQNEPNGMCESEEADAPSMYLSPARRPLSRN